LNGHLCIYSTAGSVQKKRAVQLKI
jgi:hypothetical protein